MHRLVVLLEALLEVHDDLVDLLLVDPPEPHRLHVLDLADQVQVEVHVAVVDPEPLVVGVHLRAQTPDEEEGVPLLTAGQVARDAVRWLGVSALR